MLYAWIRRAATWYYSHSITSPWVTGVDQVTVAFTAHIRGFVPRNLVICA